MRRTRSIRWKWMVGLIVLMSVVIGAAPAGAFYWYGWPGGPHPPKTVITPPHKDKPGNPPDTPPPDTPPPDTPPPPSSLPEPGTALAALIGLGVVAASRLRRRKGRQVIATPTSTS